MNVSADCSCHMGRFSKCSCLDIVHFNIPIPNVHVKLSNRRIVEHCQVHETCPIYRNFNQTLNRGENFGKILTLALK
jgi:hypothetical protein